MTDQLETLKLKTLADAERVEFGPLAFYHPLVADGDTPLRTGIQTTADHALLHAGLLRGTRGDHHDAWHE